jgi:hypothetical protein
MGIAIVRKAAQPRTHTVGNGPKMTDRKFDFGCRGVMGCQRLLCGSGGGGLGVTGASWQAGFPDNPAARGFGRGDLDGLCSNVPPPPSVRTGTEAIEAVYNPTGRLATRQVGLFHSSRKCGTVTNGMKLPERNPLYNLSQPNTLGGPSTVIWPSTLPPRTAFKRCRGLPALPKASFPTTHWSLLGTYYLL